MVAWLALTPDGSGLPAGPPAGTGGLAAAKAGPIMAQSHSTPRLQEYMVAHQVHFFLIKPFGFDDRPGQESADHEMQAGPVSGKGDHCQPDQDDVPTVLFLQRCRKAVRRRLHR